MADTYDFLPSSIHQGTFRGYEIRLGDDNLWVVAKGGDVFVGSLSDGFVYIYRQTQEIPV